MSEHRLTLLRFTCDAPGCLSEGYADPGHLASATCSPLTPFGWIRTDVGADLCSIHAAELLDAQNGTSASSTSSTRCKLSRGR